MKCEAENKNVIRLMDSYGAIHVHSFYLLNQKNILETKRFSFTNNMIKNMRILLR